MDITIQGIKGKDFLIAEGDSLMKKVAMLIEGECTIGVQRASEKYGYTEVRYYQLLKLYKSGGASALINKKRGSGKQPVRTQEAVSQIIRLRFLDPMASAAVISQKLQQLGHNVSMRSVERTITEYGLQKKLIHSTPKKKKKDRK